MPKHAPHGQNSLKGKSWLKGKVYEQSPATAGWRPESSRDYEEPKELGFPANTFRDKELLWALFVLSVDDGAEVFVAQVNFIPGGWADNYKKAKELTRDASSNLDILLLGSADWCLLNDLWKLEGSGQLAKEIEHLTWHILGLDARDTTIDTPLAKYALDEFSSIQALHFLGCL
ncbi:hypothetical protein HD806DRAFT_529937 [Xylariaceae sp. AK1471]|nr:hypothetical protein HD806DRAFT_529937 [Xylariaceae sp. AK1471]